MMAVDLDLSSPDFIARAFEDYFNFLINFYVDDTDVQYPPPGGWPHITDDIIVGELQKSPEVANILRHLPYLTPRTQIAGHTSLLNWQAACYDIYTCNVSPEELLHETQPCACDDANIIGLTSGEDSDYTFILDVAQNIVYWPNCWHSICGPKPNKRLITLGNSKLNSSRGCEHSWRSEGSAWRIGDFFEVLKHQFNLLHFIPVSKTCVLDVFEPFERQDAPDAVEPAEHNAELSGNNFDRQEADASDLVEATGAELLAASVARKHEWPKPVGFSKQEYLAEVFAAVMAHYPEVLDESGGMD